MGQIITYDVDDLTLQTSPESFQPKHVTGTTVDAKRGLDVSIINGDNALQWFDDGTFIRVVANGTILFKYRKSDKQIILSASIDTDVDLTNIS